MRNGYAEIVDKIRYASRAASSALRGSKDHSARGERHPHLPRFLLCACPLLCPAAATSGEFSSRSTPTPFAICDYRDRPIHAAFAADVAAEGCLEAGSRFLGVALGMICTEGVIPVVRTVGALVQYYQTYHDGIGPGIGGSVLTKHPERTRIQLM